LSGPEQHAFQLFVATYNKWAFAANTSDLVTLNDENFDAIALSGMTPMLVQFYAPWCGPCHSAAPVLNEVAKRGASIGKLDCETAPETAKRFAIGAYPTFVLYQGGRMQAIYRGERTVEAIETWLAKGGPT
jgi:thioredoxin-like negative regulator of GroEL